MRSCGINIVNYVKICITESKVLKYRDIAPRMKDSRPTDHKRFTRVVQNIRSRARRVLGFCNVSKSTHAGSLLQNRLRERQTNMLFVICCSNNSSITRGKENIFREVHVRIIFLPVLKYSGALI